MSASHYVPKRHVYLHCVFPDTSLVVGSIFKRVFGHINSIKDDFIESVFWASSSEATAMDVMEVNWMGKTNDTLPLSSYTVRHWQLVWGSTFKCKKPEVILDLEGVWMCKTLTLPGIHLQPPKIMASECVPAYCIWKHHGVFVCFCVSRVRERKKRQRKKHRRTGTIYLFRRIPWTVLFGVRECFKKRYKVFKIVTGS